jgi:hypothetical protein
MVNWQNGKGSANEPAFLTISLFSYRINNIARARFSNIPQLG